MLSGNIRVARRQGNKNPGCIWQKSLTCINGALTIIQDSTSLTGYAEMESGKGRIQQEHRKRRTEDE